MTLLIPGIHLDPSFKNAFVPYQCAGTVVPTLRSTSSLSSHLQNFSIWSIFVRFFYSLLGWWNIVWVRSLLEDELRWDGFELVRYHLLKSFFNRSTRSIKHMVARATNCLKRDVICICCTPRCIIIMSVFATASIPKRWLSSTPELHLNLVKLGCTWNCKNIYSWKLRFYNVWNESLCKTLCCTIS